ncbi:MAG: PD-(D/E)XK nuclease family transposase, partial [Planctomycetota bacterium]
LSHRLFPERDQAHHRFEMLDRISGTRIDNGIEIHTVELTKYTSDATSIARASCIEQWAFLLLHAQDYEPEELASLLPGVGFRSAIETIRVISAKTEDKEMYDQREKAQRDYEWALSGAREEGLEQGLERGLEQGREEGELIGKIQMLEDLLGEMPTRKDELLSQGISALSLRASVLQERLHQRRG